MSLARLPNYLKAFGAGPGTAAFARVHGRHRAAGTLFPVRLDKCTVWLRNTPSDTSIFFQVLVKREYDTSTWLPQHARLRARYDQMLQAGQVPVIIDAGANIGCASIWFSRQYPRARIVAIEPEAGNLAMLRRNVEPLANVTVIAGAV